MATVWVYRRTEPGLYTVGYYTPDGSWEPVGDLDSEDEARGLVHYLNGGQTR